MAGMQTAKKDLRKQLRGILRQIPSDSIVNQCQQSINHPQVKATALTLLYSPSRFRPIILPVRIPKCQKDQRLPLHALWGIIYQDYRSTRSNKWETSVYPVYP